MLGVVEGMNVNFKAENGSEDSHTLQKRSPQSGVGSKKREKVWLNHTELNRRIAAKIKQRCVCTSNVLILIHFDDVYLTGRLLIMCQPNTRLPTFPC